MAPITDPKLLVVGERYVVRVPWGVSRGVLVNLSGQMLTFQLETGLLAALLWSPEVRLWPWSLKTYDEQSKDDETPPSEGEKGV